MKETPTITIDMDKKCTDCGEKGVIGRGLCLKCGTALFKKQLKGGTMKIGDKTIKASIDILQSLLWEKQGDMDRAFIVAEGALSVDLKLKISPGDGVNEVEGKISFVVEKSIGEVDKVYIDEDQMDLFNEDRP